MLLSSPSNIPCKIILTMCYLGIGGTNKYKYNTNTMPNYKRAKFFCVLSFLLYHSGYKDVSECWNCTAGFHCSQPGRNSPVGPCDAGYYCPVGSASPRQVPCPPGAYCEGTSKEPKLCPSGTYQPNFTRTSIIDCISCTAGWVIFHFCLISFAMECG